MNPITPIINIARRILFFLVSSALSSIRLDICYYEVVAILKYKINSINYYVLSKLINRLCIKNYV